MNSPLENDVMLVTEYMAGGAIMEYDKKLNKYVLSNSAAKIMNGQGYSPNKSSTTNSKEMTFECADNVHRRMTEAEVVSVCLDLLCGLSYLHSKGICHRYAPPITVYKLLTPF
jgi:serine/threonine protein kinase